MAIPQQTLTVNDPGLGLVEAALTKPLLMGVSDLSGATSPATVNTKITLNSKTAAVNQLGQGPLTEAVCHVLDVAGGPVDAISMTSGTASSIGAVTPVRVSTSTGTVTTGGTALDKYEVIVEILTTGSVAAADFEFRYSLDDGNNYSEAVAVPAGATFTIPETGVTITFVDGAGPIFHEDGDTHSFDTVAPYYSAANVATAVTALLAATLDWAFIILVGTPANAAGGATIFAAMETHMATFATNYHWTRCIMDGGTDTAANVVTAMNAVDDNRVNVTFGTADTASGKPFAGYGQPALEITINRGARHADDLISTDAARVASGSVQGVIRISHDEYVTETVDIARLSSMRTWPGRSGFYFTNSRLKSAVGSDFRWFQHGRIMDQACATTYQTQQMFVAVGVRTNADGTIDERDAQRFETRVTSALRSVLTEPDNAEGTRGHVSDLSYTIDRTNNLATTEILQSEVSIRPLAYPKDITTQIGFDLSVE
jgi:hypothetical protein